MGVFNIKTLINSNTSTRFLIPQTFLLKPRISMDYQRPGSKMTEHETPLKCHLEDFRNHIHVNLISN